MTIFDKLRSMSGGKLKQSQVSALDKLLMCSSIVSSSGASSSLLGSIKCHGSSTAGLFLFMPSGGWLGLRLTYEGRGKLR